MTKTVGVFNIATGIQVEREMNAEELEQWQKDQEQFEIDKQKNAQQVAAKEAAEAKLAALGLTSDDLKALGL